MDISYMCKLNFLFINFFIGFLFTCIWAIEDYPELAKLWDCASKSPSMILFKDGSPVTRIYEQTFYLDIVAKVGQFCRAPGEEHKPVA